MERTIIAYSTNFKLGAKHSLNACVCGVSHYWGFPWPGAMPLRCSPARACLCLHARTLSVSIPAWDVYLCPPSVPRCIVYLLEHSMRERRWLVISWLDKEGRLGWHVSFMHGLRDVALSVQKWKGRQLCILLEAKRSVFLLLFVEPCYLSSYIC